MKQTIIGILLLVTLSSLFIKPTAAQEDIKEVMIATNISYADYAVASVAASKIGSALFFVSKNEIPNEILEEINSINPEKIYIIGGPAVVSEDIENELKKTYEVVRIWGMSRYGTSSEVAKYFWSEGSEEAVLVWDLPDSPEVDMNTSLMVVKAAEVAQSEEIPLLLIPKNHLPFETEDALKTLNVSKVKVFGDVGSQVFDELSSLGIEVDEKITGDPTRVREKIRERIEDIFGNSSRPIVVAAVANWQEGIVVRAAPHGVSILVFSESEIPSVVEKVKNITQTRNVSKVLVTGKPELAKKIYDALINATVNETTPVILVSGRHFRVVKKIYERVRERLREKRRNYEKMLERIREKLIKLKERVEERCDYWLTEANETIQTINTSIARARYNLILELYNSCIDAVNKNQTLLALKSLNEMKHETRKLIWENRHTKREELENELEEETESAKRVRERKRLAWQTFERRLSQRSRVLSAVRISRCRSLTKELRDAIRDREFRRMRELRTEISRVCKG